MSKERRKVEWSLDLENLRVRAGQIVTDMMGSPAETQTASLQEARDGATSARVMIDFSLGRATVSALDAGSANLFEAELRTIGEYAYEVKGGAERVISLRQTGSFPRELAAAIGNAQDLHWDIGLAQDLPLKLELKGGVGESKIDLSQLSVDEVTLETGVGHVMLSLPLHERGFTGEIKGGVGKTEAVIAAGSSGTLKVTGGVGEFTVSVSSGTAVQVKGKTGLGRISIPEGFERLEGSGKKASGVWQTADFADAESQIVIEYRGGVGSFNLNYMEV